MRCSELMISGCMKAFGDIGQVLLAWNYGFERVENLESVADRFGIQNWGSSMVGTTPGAISLADGCYDGAMICILMFMVSEKDNNEVYEKITERAKGDQCMKLYKRELEGYVKRFGNMKNNGGKLLSDLVAEDPWRYDRTIQLVNNYGLYHCSV